MTDVATTPAEAHKTPPRTMTILDIAYELRCSRSHANVVVARKDFPEWFDVGMGRVHKERRWDRRDFEQWVEEQKRETA